jgi:hypothetical protein
MAPDEAAGRPSVLSTPAEPLHPSGVDRVPDVAIPPPASPSANVSLVQPRTLPPSPLFREQTPSVRAPSATSIRAPGSEEAAAAFPRLEASRRADARARTVFGLLIFAASVVFSAALVVSANRVAVAIEGASHKTGQASVTPDELLKALRAERGAVATPAPPAATTNDVPAPAALPPAQAATTEAASGAPPAHDSVRARPARAKPARH